MTYPEGAILEYRHSAALPQAASDFTDAESVSASTHSTLTAEAWRWISFPFPSTAARLPAGLTGRLPEIRKGDPEGRLQVRHLLCCRVHLGAFIGIRLRLHQISIVAHQFRKRATCAAWAARATGNGQRPERLNNLHADRLPPFDGITRAIAERFWLRDRLLMIPTPARIIPIRHRQHSVPLFTFGHSKGVAPQGDVARADKRMMSVSLACVVPDCQLASDVK